MSFSCPNLVMEEGFCIRMMNDCVPGRRGCVLAGKSTFAISPEERIKERNALGLSKHRATQISSHKKI